MSVYMFATLFCLAFVGLTLELIRRQRLEEQYALLWLGLGIVMTVFCLFPPLLDWIARAVHIHYAPSFLFLVGLGFSLVIILHLTMVVTRLQRKLTRLIQHVALLEATNEGDSRYERAHHRSR